MRLTLPCKICAAEARFVLSVANETGDPPAIETYRCRSCGLVQVGTALRPAQLERAYAAADPESYYKETGRASERKFREAADDLLEMTGLAEGGELLEIGCGDGSLLDALRASGVEAARLVGQEQPGQAAEMARSRGFSVFATPYQALSEERPESFDVVVLMDVAEHVPDPLGLFSACRRLLRPGGLLYLHTPFISRLDRLVRAMAPWPLLRRFAGAWERGRTSIYHLQNFTPESIRICLDGFEEIAIEQRNELSWPIGLYVRIYACQRGGLPGWLAPPLALILGPVLRSRRLNANKGVVAARRIGGLASRSVALGGRA
jgi:2-polyprenyl-3-methyl-5-hydroxy-6-metoxy-1,4-benzoquinol methylase